MISVELKALAPRLNRHATKSFETALGACVNRQHYEVTIEHFLSAMLEVPGTDIHDILRNYGIEPSRLQKALTKHLDGLRSGNSSRPVLSPLLREWFQDAWLIASLETGA